MSELVLRSKFREFFEDAPDTQLVRVASDQEARALWEEQFGSGSRSYFDLPDDSWIVTAESISLGEWLRDFNTESSTAFSSTLSATVSWDAKCEVAFAVNKYTVLKTSWAYFSRQWRNFLYIDADASIVFPSVPRSEAILFRAIGDAMWIGAAHRTFSAREQ